MHTLSSISSPLTQTLAQTAGATAPTPGDIVFWAVLIVIAIVGLIFLFMILQVLKLYVQALLSDAKVALLDLIMMRFRKVPPELIVINRISAKMAGRDIATNMLEAHFLAGGNVTLVVLAESEVPKAIAEALRSGKLGIMDYYRMQNLQADTGMRSAIGGNPQDKH